MTGMPDTLTVTDNRTGRTYEIPVHDDTIRAMDLRQIKVGKEDFGLVAYDPAFINTASCRSAITFIDGDRGILEYRGYPIEQLAEESEFLEVAYLLLFGELPTPAQYEDWKRTITIHTTPHENIKQFMDGFRYDAHPMGMLLSTVGALSTFYPDAKHIFDEATRQITTIRLIAKMPSMAAWCFRRLHGRAVRLSVERVELRRATSSTCCSLGRRSPIRSTPCSSARWTSCSSCTPTTSRTAAPARCGGSAAPTPIRSRQLPARSARSTVRCTAAPTKPC